VRRPLGILIVVFFLLVPAGPGLGTTTTGAGAGAGSEETATTVTTGASAIEPAVTVEVAEPDEAPPDWTYRFFIPTLLLLATLVVVGTVVQYFTRVVRNRYRVVR
jgi:hypothetical protein